MAKLLKNHVGVFLFLFALFAVVTGGAVEDLDYDYSATIECLAEPQKAQYGGGMLINPEFEHGLNGWSIFGRAHIKKKTSEKGNNFIVAHGREQPDDSFSQKLYLHKGKINTFSAWVQISEGSAHVSALFKTSGRLIHAGAVVAESGCWSMIKGGLTVDSSGPAELYFESKNTSIEIWIDSVSLQPFTHEQWNSHRDKSIQKMRKRLVKFEAVDKEGNSLPNASLSIKLTKPKFPLGCATASPILNNQPYQRWFTSRFSVTTFVNEMKWYSTENTPGKEDYSVTDAMVSFARKNGISIRGHNILWDDEKYQPWWVKSLPQDQLKAAATRRVNSVVSRYKGQVIGWDVMNENLHFNFFESRLGGDATSSYFQQAHGLDPSTRMFMNDYNTIEESGDTVSSPANYVKKLKQIMSYPGNQGLSGIGLEGHFREANIAYMRSALDLLASTKLPIWLTEVDVQPGPNQAQYLEQILREGHSHPGVEGIVVWSAWMPTGCTTMCLTDGNFRNLPTGNVVDKLVNEWKRTQVEATADGDGLFEIPLLHGDYEVIISHPMEKSSSSTHNIKVVSTEGLDEEILYAKVHA